MRSAGSLLAFLLLVSGLAVLSTPVAAQTLAPSHAHARRAATLLAAPNRRRDTRVQKRRLSARASTHHDADNDDDDDTSEKTPSSKGANDDAKGSGDSGEDNFIVKGAKYGWEGTTTAVSKTWDATSAVTGKTFDGLGSAGSDLWEGTTSRFGKMAKWVTGSKSSTSATGGSKDTKSTPSASDDIMSKTSASKDRDDGPGGKGSHPHESLHEKPSSGTDAKPHHADLEGGSHASASGAHHHDDPSSSSSHLPSERDPQHPHEHHRRSLPSIARRAEEGKNRLPIEY